MLLNLHPAYRSSLHSIQLLAVVKSTLLKRYSIDAILRPAIEDLKELAKDVSYFTYEMVCICYIIELCAFIRVVDVNLTVQGIQVDYFGASKQLYGCLVAFIGDTPAAALVGGFKEGVGGASRGCRTCMI